MLSVLTCCMHDNQLVHVNASWDVANSRPLFEINGVHVKQSGLVTHRFCCPLWLPTWKLVGYLSERSPGWAARFEPSWVFETTFISTLIPPSSAPSCQSKSQTSRKLSLVFTPFTLPSHGRRKVEYRRKGAHGHVQPSPPPRRFQFTASGLVDTPHHHILYQRQLHPFDNLIHLRLPLTPVLEPLGKEPLGLTNS